MDGCWKYIIHFRHSARILSDFGLNSEDFCPLIVHHIESREHKASVISTINYVDMMEYSKKQLSQKIRIVIIAEIFY